MTRTRPRKPAEGRSILGAVDAIFGRWPAWPWSVLALITGGGVAGAACLPILRGRGLTGPYAVGAAEAAGYGIVAAAVGSLLPRVVRLLVLRRGLARPRDGITADWWPLSLLATALERTPRLRRTEQEFEAAVAAAGGQARSILAYRLWPACVTCFTAPVLGLVTAWQTGARVLRLQGEAADLYPAFVAQVSPPMVGTISASLALMIAVVIVDQSTKGLLQRWSGIVEPGDAEHESVVARLGQEDVDASGAAPPAAAGGRGTEEPAPPPAPLPPRRLDPAELQRLWRESSARQE